MVGCSTCSWNLDVVDYTPISGGDWEVSTPAEQGLDPMLVAELYYNAAKLEPLYGLLVVKNSFLIAEGYFNNGGIDQKTNVTSVTKSYTSALVGIALDQGYLTSSSFSRVPSPLPYSLHVTPSIPGAAFRFSA